MNIQLQPVAVVRSTRAAVADDHWGEVVSTILLDERFGEEALQGIEAFSHLDIIYQFDRVSDDKICTGARHPRGNPDWPVTGIFAQRAKDRPNKIGLCTVELLKHEGRVLTVRGLDAVDGTPVLDIKPVMREFLPRTEVRQPAWVSELMINYWKQG